MKELKPKSLIDKLWNFVKDEHSNFVDYPDEYGHKEEKSTYNNDPVNVEQWSWISSPSRIISFIANFSHILPPGNLPSFCCYCFIFGSSYGRFVDGQSLVDDPTNDNNKEDDEKIVELIDSPEEEKAKENRNAQYNDFVNGDPRARF